MSTRGKVESGSGRGRGRPPLTNREALLDAAEIAIRRGGPEVSLEAIARQAGVSKPILYAHVGGRSEFVRALMDRLASRIQTAALRALASRPPGREAVAASLLAHIATVVSDRHLYSFVNGAGGGQTSPEDSVHFARHWAETVATGIAAARSEAGRDPAVAHSWSYAILGMLHMVSLAWLYEPALERDPAKLAAELADLIWFGIKPR